MDFPTLKENVGLNEISMQTDFKVCKDSIPDTVSIDKNVSIIGLNNLLQVSIIESPKKGGKRKRNEDNWIRNIRKNNRNRGLAYLNVNNKLVEAKTHRIMDKLCCKNSCTRKFSADEQQKIFKKFYEIGNFHLQTAYLCDLISVTDKKRCYTKNKEDPRRSKTMFYYLPNSSGIRHQVCKEFFKNTIQISDGRISRALKNKPIEDTSLKDKCDQEIAGNINKNLIQISKISSYEKSGEQTPRNNSKNFIRISDTPSIDKCGGQAPRNSRTNIIKISDTPLIEKCDGKTSKDKILESKIISVKIFINKFPKYESHNAGHKSFNRQYLAPSLTIEILYDLYKQEVLEEAVSIKTFKKIFNENFNLQFHARIKVSCRSCNKYEEKIKASSIDKEKKELKVQKESHLRKAEKARQEMRYDAEMAKHRNNDITVIAFDVMKTLPVPLLSSGVCYYKRQLWTHCLGIHNLVSKETFMYIWNESVASIGPQEIGSCILHYVKNFVSTKNLIIYSNHCGVQSRNIKLSLMCNYIVANSEFKVSQIDHKFLFSGHSNLPCEQDFGLIEKAKKYHPNIYIPDDWQDVIKTALKKKPFKIVSMKEEHFFSSKKLEGNIIKREKSAAKVKVEWQKIQWLRFESHKPFCIQYKCTNQEDFPFDQLDLQKKSSQVMSNLDLLYPNGNSISKEKKKDLLQLMAYVPPIHHPFFNKLRTTVGASNDVYIRLEESDSE